ncbi:alpha-ketoacid dehydrogenase subunit beta [Kordiimonas marina]|uniref:alpha-ketoacid dehydrogenase subunit beta n=1 Tax=Kordiimonas marina TaxID=2872312 RepID=UPI001FF61CA8|nr:transketolase C-terminal domain-containing protein [Kordiimonas marina]MCJ9430106.1 alpha-ketoacid dehydrogenase subunit beta [Kordiimonas marina]
MTRMSIRDALNRAHQDLMAADDTIVVIGEDIAGGAGVKGGAELGGVFGVTRGLGAKFGEGRVIDTPISEASFIGMATGAAMTGLKPIVELMFSDFIGVAFDQILNQAAKARFLANGRFDLPLVIRTTMGAGDSSAAMHSQSLYGVLAQIPGLMVACPSTPADAAGLLKAAVGSPDPVVLFEHKGLYGHEGDVADDLPAVPLGKGRLVTEGESATVVALGAMRHAAEAAVTSLEARGISIDLIDPRTIVPLDLTLIANSVKKTGHLVVVDEGTDFGGFADAVISAVARDHFGALKAAPVAVTPPHTPIPYGRAGEHAWLPHADTITAAILALLDMQETA